MRIKIPKNAEMTGTLQVYRTPTGLGGSTSVVSGPPPAARPLRAVAFGAGGKGSLRLCYAADRSILDPALERLAAFPR